MANSNAGVQDNNRASSPNTVRVLMWNVGPSDAELWFSIFSWALVVGAIIVGLATYGVTIMGAAKEQFSNERIAANETETARANEAAEVARKDAAEANEKAESERLERLKLEARFAPRILSEAR